MTHANEFAASAKQVAGVNTSRLVVAAWLLTLLLTIGCSKEKSQPLVSTSSVSTAPTQTIAPPSPVLSAAQAATAKPIVKKAARKHASMITYKDENYGISFGYPRKYSLKTGEDLKSGVEPVAMNFTQPGGITAVSVELPNNAYPGTDLASAVFQVNVLKGLGEAECGQFAVPQSTPDEKKAVQPSDVELGGMNLREVENISGESTKQVDVKYYHLFEGENCYEFALGLTTAWDGNEDGVNLVDREDVFRRLEKILAGVKIAPELTPAASAVAATESTAKPAGGETSAAPATQSASAPQPEAVK